MPCKKKRKQYEKKTRKKYHKLITVSSGSQGNRESCEPQLSRTNAVRSRRLM